MNTMLPLPSQAARYVLPTPTSALDACRAYRSAHGALVCSPQPTRRAKAFGRWFIIASLASAYALTGVAFFLG